MHTAMGAPVNIGWRPMCGRIAFLAAHAIDQRSLGGSTRLLCAAAPIAPAYDPIAPVTDPMDDPMPPAYDPRGPGPCPACSGYMPCPAPGLDAAVPYMPALPATLLLAGLENAAAMDARLPPGA